MALNMIVIIVCLLNSCILCNRAVPIDAVFCGLRYTRLFNLFKYVEYEHICFRFRNNAVSDPMKDVF